MLKCIVVDDEPLARKILESYVIQTQELLLIGSCANAREAHELLGEVSVDLLFLDIKMPSLSGIDFLKSLKTPPAVIFTTAFSEFAVESYELDAIDYLLKPITYQRFERSVNRFFKRSTPLDPITPYTYFKVNGKLVRIEHDKFVYAQSIKDYIIIFTTDGNFITHMTMKHLADLMPETIFQRVHRSYLVGIKYITRFETQKLHLGSISVPIGNNFKMEVFSLRNKLSPN